MAKSKPMACPGCGEALTSSGKVWKCECGARWVSNSDFAEMASRMQDGHGPDGISFDDRDALWKRLSRVVQKRRHPADRQCPVCAETMKHVAYKSVELDHCETHGLFFDQAELQLALERAADDRSNAPRDFFDELAGWLGD